MTDEDLRLAAKLARAAGLVHPSDWVKVYDSHTPHEWAVQVALAAVDPWGDDRADLRAANNSLHMILSQAFGKVDQQAIDKLAVALQHYLKVQEPPSQVTTPRQARLLMGG